MEASTLQPSASLARPRVALGSPLLRLRSDEQLVELFRAGSEEAFSAIHDRYHKRLFAYARQMLPGRQDAEDALQDVFVRAYSGLRASDRELALRAWLFRIAHNRCVDELRKPTPPLPEVLRLVRTNVHDPLVELDLRESLRRLVEDIRRLPDQQRSALLMRELGGMSYAELSGSLGISVGAVKSLLVRARIALVEAAEARDTACPVIREQLVEAHDRGVRPNANARRHMRDCVGCRSFRRELRGVSRQLAATAPTLGPLGFLAKVLGFSGGAGGGAAGGAGGGAAVFGGGGATASAGGLVLGANHVATMLVAAVATAGGAVEIQRTILHQPRPVTIAAARVDRTHRADLRALPYRAAPEVDIHRTPAVVATARLAAPKPAAARIPAAAKTMKRRHPGGTARLRKVTAEVPIAAAVPNGGDLPSSSTASLPTTTTTAGGGLGGSCPAAATLNTLGAQSSTSGGATATGNASESTPTGSPTGSAVQATPSPCGSSDGSSAQAPAPSNGNSTTAGSTTSSSAGSTSTGSGSGVSTSSGSSPATGSGSVAATGSASSGETGSGATAATGSSSATSTPSSSSGTTTG